MHNGKSIRIIINVRGGKISPCERLCEGLSGEKGIMRVARCGWTALMSKSFERLTSGQKGSPETQDLRE